VSRDAGIVVVGAGLTGYSAATTLRLSGYDGPLTLVGDEPVPPYERPPLSKAVLQGKRDASDLLFQPADEYERLGIDLRLGRRATGIDTDRRHAHLDDEAIPFGKLLIATGASPVRLSQPGMDLPGVHYLRTMADARALSAEFESGKRLLVIGAGFIGCEVAASARARGLEVTMVDLLAEPMERSVGKEVGQIYAAIHRHRGVELRMRDKVAELRGHDRVEEAVLESGQRLPCDLVVIGVGVRPEMAWLEGSGIALERGLVVDEYCQTSVEGIYAAGDVASWWHPGIERRLLVEHYDNAALQGAAAARVMLGQAQPYAPLPYFWSDQYDVNLQYVGYPGRWDRLVFRGSAEIETLSLTVFYLAHGIVRGAITINRPRDLRSARRLCETGARIDPAVLADPDVDLRALSRQVQAQG
jgi:3-phenylpropionate/trans-cinnamate dioxygenase ferredoxin reductase subunit